MKKTLIIGLLAVTISNGCTTKKIEIERTFEYSSGHENQKTDTLSGITTIFDDQKDGDWMMCADNTVNKVNVEYNLAYSIVNIITLGFVSPYKVTYTCGLPEQSCGAVLGEATSSCQTDPDIQNN